MKIIINEIIEPKMPKNVRHSKPIHNRGTNTATQLEKFSYQTSNGNKVEIICKPHGNDRYEISFAVNGKMENDKSFFDREVLKTVFTLLPKIADKLNMQQIFVESFTDDNDDKTYKNLSGLNLLPQLEIEVKEAIQQYEDRIKTLIKNSQNFEYYEMEVHRLKYFLNFLQNKDNFKWEFNKHQSLTYYIKNEKLDLIYEKYRLSVLSNQPDGVKVTRNRRHSIYQKLLPKFMPNWKIQDHKFAFSLYRK